MKISYNWIKQFIHTDLAPEKISKLLTDCGLEVESTEEFQSISGGLKGLVVGEVITKEKHPDADKLSITTVNVGQSELLNIVCGAPNVAAGQKVLVALIGTTLYPLNGAPFEIKKSKIRGVVSEGMICAEDEIGIGSSHEGILVLKPETIVGTPAAEYFNIETDTVFEIGLTPNRADAASHLGVARDLLSLLNTHPSFASQSVQQELNLPDVSTFTSIKSDTSMQVAVEDSNACIRYSGISIKNVSVAESPEWLKNRLKAIGVRPINSVVDCTNYVMFELGQPLHAFDAAKIKGNKIVVKKLNAASPFITLDGIEHELSTDDLMICDESNALCIAGVFGGKNSGITETTKELFLESACFNSVSVRKTAKRHGLKTDASFRFERGTDPAITVYALKRAALLIQEICGGQISGELIDLYPSPVAPFKIEFSYTNCGKIIGKKIEHEIIKKIIRTLGIQIVSENGDILHLAVPAFKVDVQREIDVIEEVLRIYGYNQIEIPSHVNSSLSYATKPDREKIMNTVADLLTSNGFSEIMSLSLSPSSYTETSTLFHKDENVSMLNPLSSELDVLRQTLLFGGLEAIAYNQNRKRADLKLYEFGKTYHLTKNESTGEKSYSEHNHLCLFITGKEVLESWQNKTENASIYTAKYFASLILQRLGISNYKEVTFQNELISAGLQLIVNQKTVIEIGAVSKGILKKSDIKSDVFFVDVKWDLLLKAIGTRNTTYNEIPKFPEVRRDLALLIDTTISYSQIEEIAFQTEKKLLKAVNLFDVYEGEKLEAGKKSYAVSFILQDENSTLEEKQIEKIMDKLISSFREKLGASIR
jgi:phenylalanyl-tRNA synthetase beta chain